MPSPSPLPATPPPSWVQWCWRTPWLWLALIVPLVCVPLFLGLGDTDLDNDETIYSFAVETMLKDGDWVTPKSIPSETSAFLEKPPLKFWITYVPMRLGLLPPGEYGLRFMDAAMSAIAFLYVFGIGRKLAGPVCGVVAVLLLFSHNALLYEHGLRSNNMESTSVLIYAAGVYHFLAWRSLNPDVKRHIFAMSLWFVVGFMTKFVAALFLPVILGLAALIKREDRGRVYRDWPSFAWAAILAVALIAPWFVYEYYARGPRLFDIMFNAHVMKRFTAYLDPNHLHPWHYYFTQLWARFGGEGTRTFVAIAAPLFLYQVWRRRWIEGLVVVLWFGIPMAAISTGTSKLYHYAYPFLAPIAIACGWLAAAAASRVYRWTSTPVETFVRTRTALLPASMSLARTQVVLTAIGLAAVVIGLATQAFDRIQLTLGSVSIRNSSVLRPLAVAAVAWIAAAPGAVLRAALVAVLLAAALPLAAYRENVSEARQPRRPMQNLRECLAPYMDAHLAAGGKPHGTYVEASSLSFIPFYYLRHFGPWQQGSGETTPLILSALLSPVEPRFVLLSPERFESVVAEIATDRSAALERAAVHSGVDAGTLGARLDESPIGLLRIQGNSLLLPGPFAACGEERVRLAPAAGYLTTSVPFSIFMPHSNATSPAFDVGRRITTRWSRGSARRTFADATNTSLAQVSSVLRTKTRSIGRPALTLTVPGTKPSFVIATSTVWEAEPPAGAGAVAGTGRTAGGGKPSRSRSARIAKLPLMTISSVSVIPASTST